MFDLTNDQLKKNNAGHTAMEIYQQPRIWQEMLEIFIENQEVYQQFLQSIYQKHEQVRVIFTGAGTSAFTGDTLVPALRKRNKQKVHFESIATTNIVSNPEEYFMKEIPTILVSFARSGNSPESVAAVSLANQMIDEFYQVIITCNKDGQLARDIQGDSRSITILTPERAHDQGFAMTSSFTSMLIAAYLLFSSTNMVGELNKVNQNASSLVDSIVPQVEDVIAHPIERIVYLGSGMLAELAHEASLKMLELTAGNVVATYESSLGFRHGPKSILNDKSMVVLFFSQDSYTRKYDLDILRELAADGVAKILVLDEKEDDEVSALADWVVPVNGESSKLQSDFSLALLYSIVFQLLALKKSIQLGITPDNPSPDGHVNRVVKGVTIYPWKG